MPSDEAIVLVGGLGTRLRSTIGDLPKPLAPVAGRPFLAWILDHLAESGMRRVILATGYQADRVEQVIGTRWRDMRVDYSVETQPLGTGGAVRLAADRLSDGCAHVVNGDTYLRYAPAALEEATRARGAMLGIALAHVADGSRYGSVEMRDGRVLAFGEKTTGGPACINAGCYFLTRRAMEALPDRAAFSLEHDFLFPLSGAGQIAVLTEADGFIDIGVPGDYARAQSLFGEGAE